MARGPSTPRTTRPSGWSEGSPRFVARGGRMTSTAMWYVTRGTGIVALILLTGSVVLGIVNQTRWHSEGWQRFTLQDLHKNISLVALAVVAVHVSTSVIARFAPIGWKDTL